MMNDDQILDARDMAAEIAAAREPQPRTFADVLNQWTDTMLEENAKADTATVLLLMRVGTLGQRLIFEANQLGMQEATRMLKERL